MRWVVGLVAVVGVLGWGLSTLDPSGQGERVTITALTSGSSTDPFGHAGSPTTVGGWSDLCQAASTDYPELLGVAAGSQVRADLPASEALALLQRWYSRDLLVDAPSTVWTALSTAIDGVDDAADGSVTDEALIRYVTSYRAFSSEVLPTC